MNLKISVVIPAFNAQTTVAEAVRSVLNQSLPAGTFECIVVDDGSSDRTGEIAEGAGAVVLRLPRNLGVCGARNAGIHRARGKWIAFTDADCVTSRRWLASILAEAESADDSVLIIAGKVLGLESQTPPARFVDLIGGLDAETYLRHKTLPWAPGGNVAYRREQLLAVGGFDQELKNYETPDLQLRLSNRFGGRIVYLPAAVVLHRHRSTWRGFWKQQRNYGMGYAQFILKHSDRWPWSTMRELSAWKRIVVLAAQACVTRGDKGLARRGLFVKLLAQRIGFVSEFFPAKCNRWLPFFAGRKTGAKTRASKTMRGSRLPLWLAVGHFILRAPRRMARTDLQLFLARVAAQPRGDGDLTRVARITRRWLRQPGFRARDTCYMRSLVLFRFANPQDRDLCLHFGVDEVASPDERLHGHAWVSLDGVAWNPPKSFAENRLREIYRFSTVNGGSSASGAEFVAAIIRNGDAVPASGSPVPA